MNIPIRLAPSGPVVATFGSGAILRLQDTTSLMTGSAAIPLAPGLICPDGFGATDAIVLTIPTPNALLKYGAELELDVVNNSTSGAQEVVLYLDISIDGGTTYTNFAKNVHHMSVVGQDPSAHTPIGSNGRTCSVHLPQTLGSALGIDNAAPPASLKLRARASAPLGVPLPLVDSVSSSGGTPVTGCNGTIYMSVFEALP